MNGLNLKNEDHYHSHKERLYKAMVVCVQEQDIDLRKADR